MGRVGSVENSAARHTCDTCSVLRELLRTCILRGFGSVWRILAYSFGNIALALGVWFVPLGKDCKCRHTQ